MVRPAEKLAEAAAIYWKKEKPALLLLHFADTDSVGHQIGWDTPEFLAALARVDSAIGKMQRAVVESGLAGSTLLIVTADHGGTGKTHGDDIPEHRNIPWIAHGVGVKAGAAISELRGLRTGIRVRWSHIGSGRRT